jgi:hypothetical protein
MKYNYDIEDGLLKAKETKPPMSDTDLSYAEKKPEQIEGIGSKGYEHPTNPNITQYHTGVLGGQTVSSKGNKDTWTRETGEGADKHGIIEQHKTRTIRGSKIIHRDNEVRTPAYSRHYDAKTQTAKQGINPALPKKSMNGVNDMKSLNVEGVFTMIKSLENLPFDKQEEFLKSQRAWDGDVVVVRKGDTFALDIAKAEGGSFTPEVAKVDDEDTIGDEGHIQNEGKATKTKSEEPTLEKAEEPEEEEKSFMEAIQDLNKSFDEFWSQKDDK